MKSKFGAAFDQPRPEFFQLQLGFRNLVTTARYLRFAVWFRVSTPRVFEGLGFGPF